MNLTSDPADYSDMDDAGRARVDAYIRKRDEEERQRNRERQRHVELGSDWKFRTVRR